MRKVLIKTELICPFNKCRICLINEQKDNGMSVNCESCQYVWNRKVRIISQTMILNEDSKEYKEYETLHTPVCVNEKR